ncbi:MAG: hypothetical protein MJ252_18635 [archaeon]|nr:hypothetical protein [archaeon]
MEKRKNPNEFKAFTIDELRSEKMESTKSLRKKKVDEVLMAKRNILPRKTAFFLINNFIMDQNLIQKMESCYDITERLAPCAKEVKDLRDNKQLVNELMNFLLCTQDVEQFKKLLDIFVSWSFMEHYIMEMLGVSEVAHTIFGKVFNVFGNNLEIFERGVLIINHIVLSEARVLEENNFLDEILNLYLNHISNPQFSTLFTLRVRNGLLWGSHMILHNFAKERQNILDIKKLILRVSIQEIQVNLSQFNVQNGSSSNLIKVVMMWVHEFIDPEAKDKAAERNETTKSKMIKHDPFVLFTIEDLIGIFDLMVGVHETYLPFSYLSEHSMRYDVAEVHKMVLVILHAILCLKQEAVERILEGINRDKLTAFFIPLFSYYKDNFRFCDTFNHFFKFIIKLTYHRSHAMEVFFENYQDSDLLKFNFFARDIADEEIRICYNFFNNYSFNVCMKYYSNDYQMDVIMHGLRSDNLIEKENTMTLIQTMINKFSENQQADVFKEKLERKNALLYIERVLDLQETDDNKDLIEKARQLYGYLNQRMIEDDL